MFSPAETLGVLSQLAVAIAGFAGIVAAIGKGSWEELNSLRLGNLLLTTFVALAISGLGLILLHMELPDRTIWKITSGVWMLAAIFGMINNYKNIRKLRALDPTTFSMIDIVVVNLSLWAVFALQIYNVMEAGEFWPLLVGIIWTFGMACFSFTRLIFARVAHDAEKST